MGRIHPLTILCAIASGAGFLFAAVSTSDFIAHLDRQVHGIHCSFLPGLGDADVSGASGCHATLMSPYSSVLRDSIWGGVPVALPGMAVFAFLGFWCIWLAINGRDREERATGFLFVGSLVPLTTSGVMGYLSLVELDAACKMCIGIYASSAVLSISALVLWRRAAAQKEEERTPPKSVSEDDAPRPSRTERPSPLSWGTLGLGFAAGLTCVGISVGAYAAAAPDFSKYVGSCGSIPHMQAPPGVLIPFGEQRGNPTMLEVIDPLCPSCKGFESRFSKMPISSSVDRQLLLFPLDESCNWMIDRSMHPGACSISEAVLCSSDPGPVLDWAFENQKAIMLAAEKNPNAAAEMAKKRFPALSQCIGSPEAGAKVNQSLRFAVKNQLPILTPQVFVEGTRLCGEDTDLGLDYALPRLLAHAKNQPRPKASIVSGDVKAEEPEPIRQAPRKKVKTNNADFDAAERPKADEDENQKASDAEPSADKPSVDEPHADEEGVAEKTERPSDDDSDSPDTSADADKTQDDSAEPVPPPPSSPAPSEETE